MTDRLTPSNDTLDAKAVLAFCHSAIPVNCSVDAAVEAHKAAAWTGQEPLTTHALRAVILAAPLNVPAIQRQFDYLAGLPSSAWKHYGGSDMRELTLRMVTRSIRWRQEA